MGAFALIDNRDYQFVELVIRLKHFRSTKEVQQNGTGDQTKQILIGQILKHVAKAGANSPKIKLLTPED